MYARIFIRHQALQYPSYNRGLPQILRLKPIMPSSSISLTRYLTEQQRRDACMPSQLHLLLEAIARVAARPDLSKDTQEVVNRALAG